MPAPTRELLHRFDAAHREKFGVPAYIVGGKHATILARIWALYGTDVLMELIGKFFEGNTFADDCGYSIEVFASQVPRTLMKLEQDKPKVSPIDWFEECKRVHNGECGLDRYRHGLRMQAVS